jgi:cysteine desulfurase
MRFSGSVHAGSGAGHRHPGTEAEPMPERIYFDHSSTTPVAPEVLEAMLPFFGARFGVSSSLHGRGLTSRRAIDEARAEVAGLLAVPADEILLTSSATESNNLALKGMAAASGPGGGHLIGLETEHIATLHPLRTLEKQGFRVTLLPVDRHGEVDPDDLARALRDDTILVSVAHASGEIGTVQPIEELCRVARSRGVPFHCDATLTAGTPAWPQTADGPDLVTLTSHLLYGPQGIAALRVRKGLRLLPLIEGGTQEGGLRAGTEPLAAVVGFGAAARLASKGMGRRDARARDLAGRLRRALAERLDGLVWTGHSDRRLPGHVSFCILGAEAEAVLQALDEAGIEAASGSACTTGARKPSHVLQAIGIDPVTARGAITFSAGDLNRDGDPELAAAALEEVVSRLRSLSPWPLGPDRT